MHFLYKTKKVDLEVARRILIHLNLKQSDQTYSSSESFSLLFSTGSPPSLPKSILQPIIELFLSIPFNSLLMINVDSPIHSSELLNLLRLLEDATREMEALQSFQKEHGTKINSPWQLVSSFCQFHNLPRSLTLLHELARNNEWIMLLYEAYSQRCPIDTLQDIIEKYLHSGPLQKHLLNWISTFNKKTIGINLGLDPDPFSYSYLLENFSTKSTKTIVLRLNSILNDLIKNDKISNFEAHNAISYLGWELKNPFFVILAYGVADKESKFSGFSLCIHILSWNMINSNSMDKNSKFYNLIKVNENKYFK